MADVPSEEKSSKFINLGVVVNEQGEVLMIRRAKPEEGKEGATLTWAFPGGKQRLKGENREECVKREVLAETGYAVESLRQISLRMHPQFQVLIVYHRCRLASPEQVVQPQQDYEVAEIRWVPPEQVRELITTDLDPAVAKELDFLTRSRRKQS